MMTLTMKMMTTTKLVLVVVAEEEEDEEEENNIMIMMIMMMVVLNKRTEKYSKVMTGRGTAQTLGTDRYKAETYIQTLQFTQYTGFLILEDRYRPQMVETFNLVQCLFKYAVVGEG